MQDHTQGSSLHSQALETIQDRLREAEIALKREQDSYHQMQVPVMSHFIDESRLKTRTYLTSLSVIFAERI